MMSQPTYLRWLLVCGVAVAFAIFTSSPSFHSPSQPWFCTAFSIVSSSSRQLKQHVVPQTTIQGSPFHQRNTALASSTTTKTSSQLSTDVPTQLPLPPGRPTSGFRKIFCDDTLRLLNPKRMARYQLTRQTEYGPIYKTNIFFTPTVFVTSDETIQELSKQEALHKQSFQACFPPHHQKLFGPNSILVTSGPSHDKMRQLIQSSLTPNVVNNVYNTVVQGSIESFFQTLQTEQQQLQADNSYRAMVPKVRSFFIQLMLQVVLGGGKGDVETSDNHDESIQNLIDRLTHDIEIWSRGLLAPPLTFVPWSRASKALRARQRIVSQMEDMIVKGQYRTNGLLAKLLDARITITEPTNSSSFVGQEVRLSNGEIIDNVLTLLFAGSDTTASATISVWKVLSEHPIVKDDLLRRNDESSLESFVQLVLQAYPAAPFGMRLITASDITIGKYRVPQGWMVVYGLAGALLSRTTPNAWTTVDDEADSKKTEVVSAVTPSTSSSTYSWLPFGMGPRQCPGRYLASLELKYMTRQLCQLQWELQPHQNLRQQYTPGFFPVDGFQVKFLPPNTTSS